MAITVDWLQKIIYVPKADLTLIQASPTEIRNLDANWFHGQLRSAEASEGGIVHLDTHNHNTEVTLGGLTFARVIEITGYTVTFEDGQWAVNITGGNTNIADVTNVNQVSVRPYNSAGLISSPDIEFSAYADGVYLDETSPATGTTHPRGTLRMPIGNLTDAMLIIDYRGVPKINVIGNAEISSSGDYSGMVFIGESHDKTKMTVLSSSDVSKCEYYSAEVAGTLDGDSVLRDCLIGDLTYVSGEIKDCILKPGVITLGGSDTATFVRCVTEQTSPTAEVVINMGGSGQPLYILDSSMTFTLKNKTGSDACEMIMAGGTVAIDLTTVTSGTVRIKGVCDVVDYTTGAFLSSGTYGTLSIVNNALSTDTLTNNNIVNEVVTAILSSEIEPGYDMKAVLQICSSVLAGIASGSGTSEMVFRDLNNLRDVITATLDGAGNRTAIIKDVA